MKKGYRLKELYASNYKNVVDLKVKFPDAGVILISGRNRTGKSSIRNIIENQLTVKEPLKEPTHLEKENGVTIGTYKGDNKIEVTERFEKNGKTIFSFINNEIQGSGVTELKNIFNYTSFTAQEIINLTKTAKGQKELQEIILNLLSIEDKQEFYKLKDLEKSLYDERTIVNSKVKDIETSIKNNTLLEEDKKKLDKYDEAYKYLKELQKELSEIELLTEKKKNLIQSKNSFESNINTALVSLSNDFKKETIDDFKTIVDKINAKYQKDIEDIKIPLKEDLEVNIEKGNTFIDSVEDLKRKEIILKEKEKDLVVILQKQKKFNEDITNTRKKLKNFFNEKDLPIKGLVISDDGLAIQTEAGILPFNDNQLSTSTIMLLTLELMYYINQDTPILFLGEIKSFDNDNFKTIIKFAEEKQCQIFTEEVTNDDKFVIEIIIDENNKKEIFSATPNKEIDITKKTIIKEKLKVETKEIPLEKEIKKEEKIIDKPSLFD